MVRKSESWSVAIARICLLLIGVGGCAYTLYLFSSAPLSPRESTLLGILLTICSSLTGWMITHIYSASQMHEAIDEVQERSQASLKTYALKASEKVNNLSNELNRLAVFLEQQLNDPVPDDAEFALSDREQRLQTAIHIIRTLKSVNDTSLSDWEGVIGDELHEQREERLEKEQQVQELAARVETLIEGQRQDLLGNQGVAANLRHELQSVREDLRVALSQLSGTTLSPKPFRPSKKQAVEQHCPVCSEVLTFQQKASATSFKSFPCKACGTKLISRYRVGDGFVLEIRAPKEESAACPNCGKAVTAMLDVTPGSVAISECKSCSHFVRFSRSATGINTKDITSTEPVARRSKQELTEDFLNAVQSMMPPQPWPSGAARAVAKRLAVSPSEVSRAVNELMRRGIYKPQINGVLYEPIPSSTSSASPENTEE